MLPEPETVPEVDVAFSAIVKLAAPSSARAPSPLMPVAAMLLSASTLSVVPSARLRVPREAFVAVRLTEPSLSVSWPMLLLPPSSTSSPVPILTSVPEPVIALRVEDWASSIVKVASPSTVRLPLLSMPVVDRLPPEATFRLPSLVMVLADTLPPEATLRLPTLLMLVADRLPPEFAFRLPLLVMSVASTLPVTSLLAAVMARTALCAMLMARRLADSADTVVVPAFRISCPRSSELPEMMSSPVPVLVTSPVVLARRVMPAASSRVPFSATEMVEAVRSYSSASITLLAPLALMVVPKRS